MGATPAAWGEPPVGESVACTPGSGGGGGGGATGKRARRSRPAMIPARPPIPAIGPGGEPPATPSPVLREPAQPALPAQGVATRPPTLLYGEERWLAGESYPSLPPTGLITGTAGLQPGSIRYTATGLTGQGLTSKSNRYTVADQDRRKPLRHKGRSDVADRHRGAWGAWGAFRRRSWRRRG